MTVDEIEEFLEDFVDVDTDEKFPISVGIYILYNNSYSENMYSENGSFFYGFVEDICDTITIEELTILRNLRWFVMYSDKLDKKMFYHTC